MKVNINDTVRVKLTDAGRQAHHDRYAMYGRPYSPPQEDAEGWSKWQLWELMGIFGKHINLGGRHLPFETTIEIVVEPGGRVGVARLEEGIA